MTANTVIDAGEACYEIPGPVGVASIDRPGLRPDDSLGQRLWGHQQPDGAGRRHRGPVWM